MGTTRHMNTTRTLHGPAMLGPSQPYLSISRSSWSITALGSRMSGRASPSRRGSLRRFRLSTPTAPPHRRRAHSMFRKNKKSCYGANRTRLYSAPAGGALRSCTARWCTLLPRPANAAFRRARRARVSDQLGAPPQKSCQHRNCAFRTAFRLFD